MKEVAIHRLIGKVRPPRERKIAELTRHINELEGLLAKALAAPKPVFKGGNILGSIPSRIETLTLKIQAELLKAREELRKVTKGGK